MASMNGLSKLGLPKLSDNMDPEDARVLRSYLYQMQEQLQYILTNLDTENMSDTLRSLVRTIAPAKGKLWEEDASWQA